MRKTTLVLTILVIASVILSACGGGGNDLLDVVKERGYLVVSTDPNYEPQSFLDPTAVRAEGTVCPDDMLTYGEMKGFDIDVAKAVADGLGVEVCFATPDWDIITAGSWGDRWDISIGSMTITKTRQEALDFALPYYYTPAQFAAASDSGYTSLDDLEGETICVATATTYLDWFNGELTIPESSILVQPPSDFTLVELPTDQECAQSIAAGRPEFSVYLTSDTVINSNMAGGLDVVKLGPVVFVEELAPAIDKNSSYDTAAFIDAVSNIIKGLHANGTLSSSSMEWFEVDLTKDPR
ncbi:MAG TPA: transporter substrate-binding domain-containing protein [Anaerolineales bacterium]|nr:transporter substrate-binding domain-containing protein [Anaerolineales bacterium]